MGFLRVFGLVFVNTRLGGQIIRPEFGFDGVARCRNGLGGHVDAVGSHIGDQTGLIQALCHGHGLARAKAEFAAGLLLQG